MIWDEKFTNMMNDILEYPVSIISQNYDEW